MTLTQCAEKPKAKALWAGVFVSSCCKRFWGVKVVEGYEARCKCGILLGRVEKDADGFLDLHFADGSWLGKLYMESGQIRSR